MPVSEHTPQREGTYIAEWFASDKVDHLRPCEEDERREEVAYHSKEVSPLRWNASTDEVIPMGFRSRNTPRITYVMRRK